MSPVAEAVQNLDSFGQLSFIWSFQVGKVPCEAGPAVPTQVLLFSKLLHPFSADKSVLERIFS